VKIVTRERGVRASHLGVPSGLTGAGRAPARARARARARPAGRRYGRRVAYDEVLADRVREAMAVPFTEKRMFGGNGFMLRGNLALGVLGDDLVVRVGPDAEALTGEPGAGTFEGSGRPMSGWLRVAGEVLDDDVLAAWVARGVEFTATLPAK
jgi:hypothetical protein